MRFKKKYRRRLWWIVVLVGFLFLLALAARQGGKLIDRWLVVKSRPGSVVNTEQPVSATVLFNDEPGTEIFSERIASEIGQARQSLKIAMYAFTSQSLKEAVYAAAKRGIAVTIITDSRKHDQQSSFFADAPAGIKFLEAGAETNNKTILMHHKFALIDNGEPSQKLIFGSYNWTDLQEKYDPSFLLVTDNSDLIASFGREFDRVARSKSGINKLKDKTYHPWDLSLRAAGKNYEVWFSPGREGDGIKNRLGTLINGAQKDLKIMIWEFTDKDLAVDLIRRARAGVRITLITDTANFNNKNSVFQYLAGAKQAYHLDNFELLTDKASGAAAKNILAEAGLDSSFDPFLHYHVLIADDNQVLFGTNNWSRAGAYYNDESIIVSDDPALVLRFEQAFAKQYQRNSAR